MSAFFLGYLPMQIGGALLSRRYGAKRVLAYGAALWSAFTALTPAAARSGFHVLLVCRVCMGLSEGVAFPAIFHYLACWIPKAERGRAVSTFLVGVHVGTTLALVLSPKIITRYSWQAVFYVFGAAGGVWILFWVLLARDRDADPCEDTDRVSEIGRDGSRTRSLSEMQTTSNLHYDGVADNSRHSVRRRLGGAVLSPSERRALRFICTSTPCLAICCTQFIMSFCHCTIISLHPNDVVAS
jgi:MFS family permease